MMEPPDFHGSSRHNASILSGIDRGTVTVRWKVVVDARAVAVEESPQGLRDVAVLAVSQGVVPLDDRHAAAEHHHRVNSAGETKPATFNRARRLGVRGRHGGVDWYHARLTPCRR